MRRSQFLKLSLLPLPALLCGIPPASPFQRWMHRFSARMLPGAGGQAVEVSIQPRELAQALRDLDAVTDGPMRCEGAFLRVRADGADLQLHFV